MRRNSTVLRNRGGDAQAQGLARQMNTSRAQLDRLLDPENQSVTLRTVARAANILGMKVQIELVQS